MGIVLCPLYTTESGSVSYRRYCLPPLLADLELANHLGICKFLYLCKCMSFTLRPSRENQRVFCIKRTFLACIMHISMVVTNSRRWFLLFPLCELQNPAKHVRRKFWREKQSECDSVEKTGWDTKKFYKVCKCALSPNLTIRERFFKFPNSGLKKRKKVF